MSGAAAARCSGRVASLRRPDDATSGYRNDGDAGLTHVGARYYDAQVGRFLTRDTDLKQKPYLYCEHDPVNGTDPSGHMPWYGWFETGGTMVAAVGYALTRVGNSIGPPYGPPTTLVGTIVTDIGVGIGLIGAFGHMVIEGKVHIDPYIPPDNPFGYGQGGY